MILYVLLSSIASGLIATGVMVFFLYLPRLWNGNYYDVLGALGSAVTQTHDGRAYFVGSVLYFAGGIVFALLYGAVAASLLTSGALDVPQLTVLPDFPIDINLFFPLIGVLLGLAHGIVVALLVTIVVEHHPLERYRIRLALALSQVIGHLAFGLTVMFFHSQFLQLLLRAEG